jgi:hypothetical protein
MWKTPARSIRGVVAKAKALSTVCEGSTPAPEGVRVILNDLAAILDYDVLPDGVLDGVLKAMLAMEPQAQEQ